MVWIAAFVSALLGLGLLAFGRGRARALLPVADGASRRAIHELDPGRYYVAGRVVPIEVSESLIDGMPCVFLERAEYRTVGSAMVPLLREVSRTLHAHPFFVDDGTGRVLVDPADADIECATLEDGDGLFIERRLRAGEEIELVASYAPAELQGDGGPYRDGATVWASVTDEVSKPKITFRTERDMVRASDEVSLVLRSVGAVLVVAGAALGIAGAL